MSAAGVSFYFARGVTFQLCADITPRRLRLKPIVIGGLPGFSRGTVLTLSAYATKKYRSFVRAKLFPGPHRSDRAVSILLRLRWRGPMRVYVTAAGLAFGLIAVWAALVQLVA